MIACAGEMYYQTYIDFLDAIASASKFEIPLFQTKNWHPFTVLASERFTTSQLNNLYGTSQLTYKNALIPAYGDKERSNYFSYRIPENVKEVNAIYNRLLDPSLIMMDNLDFAVDADRHAIHFASDPFENPLVPKRDVLNDRGEVVDQEILLWFNMSQWDHDYIFNQFGYVVKIWMKTSSFYKDFVSAVWDHLTLGPTKATLKLALMAMTGVRFAIDQEVVSDIIYDSDSVHVVTPLNLYTFPSTTTLLVAVGDTIRPGDPLCDAVLIIEPSQTTDWSSVRGVAVGDAMLRMGGVRNPITFENMDTELEYLGIDQAGKAVVQFSVSGFPQDVAEFWRQSHAEGINLGLTLAEALDTRKTKVGQPLPQDLPQTINPFEFVMDNLFSNNLFVILMKPEQFAQGAPGLQGLEYLYKYLTPQTTYMIFIEMNQGEEYYSVGDSEDTLAFQKSVDPITDTTEHLYKDFGPSIKRIKENCR